MPVNEYGDMQIGMMCLNCGYLTDVNDMEWIPIFEFRENDVPLVHLLCPKCHHIKSNEVITYISKYDCLKRR